MATINPFAGDNEKGDVWEQGYLAGFAEPDESHFRPFSEELIEVYWLGEQAGRVDRLQSPDDSESSGFEGHSWVSEVAEGLGEHVLLHSLGQSFDNIFKTRVGGLATLVITVLSIPGDVQLRPLKPEWSGSDGQEGDIYVAVCPYTDHEMVIEGEMDSGYWAGPGRSNFRDAFSDMKNHGHAEAFVARCSLPDVTCGPVWPIQ